MKKEQHCLGIRTVLTSKRIHLDQRGRDQCRMLQAIYLLKQCSINHSKFRHIIRLIISRGHTAHFCPRET